MVITIADLNPKEKATPIRVTQCCGTTTCALGKNLLGSTAQIKVGSVNCTYTGIPCLVAQALKP